MYIRNQYTGEYLTADAHVRSIIDEYSDFKWNEGFRRHFVGFVANSQVLLYQQLTSEQA
jgi:hypothetical protein